MVKILVIGDLHGRRPRLLTKDFDAIILVGDICDDRKIGPLYKRWFRAIKKDPEVEFEDIVRQTIGKRKLKVYEKESLEKGRETLKYLDSLGKPIFMVAGNWDQSFGKTKIKNESKSDYYSLKAFYDMMSGKEINPKLTRGIKNLENCMFKNCEFEGINIFGYGLSNSPEKRDFKKYDFTKAQVNSLKKSYNRLVEGLFNSYKNGRNKRLLTFFVTHNIPNGTRLDKITDKKSYAYKKHLGSTIARDFCKKFQPEICVGGHIHDHRGKDKIKKTIVVNPGYGPKSQVLFDIDAEKRKVKKIKFLN